MYARITPYKMKPGSKAAATQIMETLKGQQSFLNVMNDNDGSGYVISTTNIAEATPETVEKVNALWANFKDHLVEEPSAKIYEVVADWS